MSVAAMTLVWSMELPAFEKLVALALADCANDEGLCWPSIATLRRKTGASERTVQRALNALEEAKVLVRRQVPGKGCKYVIHPRQSDTPVPKSPPSGRREPPSQRHHTPVTVTPKPSKNHQEPLKSIKRASSLPAGWKPEVFGSDTESRQVVDGWPPGELKRQLEHFSAHHKAKGNTFSDWQQAWSTWVLNNRNFGNGRTGNHSTPRATSTRTAAQQAIERLQHTG